MQLFRATLHLAHCMENFCPSLFEVYFEITSDGEKPTGKIHHFFTYDIEM